MADATTGEDPMMPIVRAPIEERVLDGGNYCRLCGAGQPLPELPLPFLRERLERVTEQPQTGTCLDCGEPLFGAELRHRGSEQVIL